MLHSLEESHMPLTSDLKQIDIDLLMREGS